METGPVKFWTLLPWVCGAVVLAGVFVPAPTALIFFRTALLVAVLLATTGAIAAARMFDHGDGLFVTWSVLAGGYVLLAIRYVLRLLVTLNVMQMPVMFDRALLIVHNIAVPVALYLFVRSWRRTGLTMAMSRTAAMLSTAGGFVVALAIGAFPLIEGMHNTDPALLISTLGDMAGIALIVPLLMPALEMRGGLLMYTWLYLACAQLVWLMYDIWAVARTGSTVSSALGLAIDQALRTVALTYIFSAASAQRRAIAQTDLGEETTARKRTAVPVVG